jgi:hypothetical protein
LLILVTASLQGPPGDVASAKKYIGGRYLRCDRRKQKSNNTVSGDLYSHFTCATDTRQIENVFKDVVEIIVKNSLQNMDLM